VQGTLSGDDTWEGMIEVTDDFLVPGGVTLTVRPGTTVRILRADTGRTEPEFLDNATEILVRGRLVSKGKDAARIVFAPAAPSGSGEEPGWAGIIFDGGEGELRHSRVTGSEYGLLLLSSSPRLENVRVDGVKHGIMIYGPSRPVIRATSVEAAEGGIYCWRGAAPDLDGVRSEAGEREGLLVAPGAAPVVRESVFKGPLGGVLWGSPEAPPPGITRSGDVVISAVPGADLPEDSPRELPVEVRDREGRGGPAKTYRDESFIGRDEIWEGRIRIDGTVMVAPGAVLTLRPGTVVSFAWRDTNGDGVGESELFIQGRIVARGERKRPIVFTSVGARAHGRWGAVNIMGSDAEENVFTHCLVENSYRGLHSHFSKFRVENSLFRNNWRALQFQESTAVILGSTVTGNRSGLRFRDSTVIVEGCRVENNTSGLQTLRSRLSLISSSFVDNVQAGIHLRETEGVVAGNRITGNSPGLRASAGRFRLESNLLAGNSYGGVQLRGSVAEITGNIIHANVGNGLFVDSPSAVLKNNSFQGNLRFALENNAPTDLDAAGNFWGVKSGGIPARIFDAGDDPRVGAVRYEPPLETSPPVPATGPR
jgi:hypothetical protein